MNQWLMTCVLYYLRGLSFQSLVNILLHFFILYTFFMFYIQPTHTMCVVHLGLEPASQVGRYLRSR